MQLPEGGGVAAVVTSLHPPTVIEKLPGNRILWIDIGQ